MASQKFLEFTTSKKTENNVDTYDLVATIHITIDRSNIGKTLQEIIEDVRPNIKNIFGALSANNDSITCSLDDMRIVPRIPAVSMPSYGAATVQPLCKKNNARQLNEVARLANRTQPTKKIKRHVVANQAAISLTRYRSLSKNIIKI